MRRFAKRHWMHQDVSQPVSEFADLVEQGFNKLCEENSISTEVKMIIRNLIKGDKDRAISYAELYLENRKKRYEQTKDVFDKYKVMGAENIIREIKGEPLLGGRVVLDSTDQAK